MAQLFANIGGPDQTPRSAASDLGLHCLQLPFIGVSRLLVQWVKVTTNWCTTFPRTPFGPGHTKACQRAYADSESPDQGLHYPLTESLDTTECMNVEHRP